MKHQRWKRILACTLAFCLLFGLFPGLPGLIPSAQAADIDAFGIQMYEFTESEKAKAAGELPFGAAFESPTSLLTKDELFLSYGYDWGNRHTIAYDMNGNKEESQYGKKLNTLLGNSDGSIFQLSNKPTGTKIAGENYSLLETAAMDVNRTGRKEYVAQLGYTGDGKLRLSVIHAKEGYHICAPVTLDGTFDQLNTVDGYQRNGAISLICGDFDGDGQDSIILYRPDKTINNDNTSNYSVEEYVFKENTLQNVSTVSGDLLGEFAQTIAQGGGFADQPLVSLVAEDADGDGLDELIMTVSMSDTKQHREGRGRLGSQLAVYDYYRTNDGKNGAWNKSFCSDLSTTPNGTADNQFRLVWASSTVGNVNVSTSTTQDYPEIISAGFVDTKAGNSGWDIDVENANPGVVMTTANNIVEKLDTGVAVDKKNKLLGNIQNTVCSYSIEMQHTVEANGFTDGGFYKKCEINGLMAVQAFADLGKGARESVFISGSVYRMNSDNAQLAPVYTPDYFTKEDDDAQWSSTITNTIDITTVCDVTAGNFDGNNFGREQIVATTQLEKKYDDHAGYSKLYFICNNIKTNEKGEPVTDQNDVIEPGGSISDNWAYAETQQYLYKAKQPAYVSVTPVDTDDDSRIVTLKAIDRSYSEPGVMAVLEATPYFGEIGDGDTGNGQTVYGTSTISGSGSSNSFGFSAGVSVGTETDTGLTKYEFETTVTNSFNWTFSNSIETEMAQNFANDTGENVVVVYRCPVVLYTYEDAEGNAIAVSKTGQPATNMIPVEQYNRAASYYKSKKLDTIPESVLSEPGNPASYRGSLPKASNPIYADRTGNASNTSWVQYSGVGTTEQSITVTNTSERDFDYELAVDVSFKTSVGLITDGTMGGSAGLSYGHTSSSMNGNSVTKSGSVTGQQVDGYDFQWRFAAWDISLNGMKVPVIGYLVNDVVAPPSPAHNPRVDTVDQTSATIAWDTGTRAAQQYFIYRLMENGDHVLLGAAGGEKTEYTLKNLKPGSSYTYVVRGVAYEADGDRIESVDSSPVIVRTRSADADDGTVTVTGADRELAEGNIYKTDGTTVTLQADAYNLPHATSLTHRWELRYPGDTSAWKQIGGTMNGIETISGANTQKLTLSGLNSALLNGAMVRCVVTAATGDGTPDPYYSNYVTLDISRNPTKTTLTVSGYEADSDSDGTMAKPWTGYAGYTVQTEQTTEVKKQVEVVIEEDTTANRPQLTVYSYEASDGNTVYVGTGFDNTSGQVYYVVTKNGSSYTVGAKLTTKTEAGWKTLQDGSVTEYNAPEDFTGEADSAEFTENSTSNPYLRMAMLTPQDEDGKDDYTVNELWVRAVVTGADDAQTTVEKYYTKDDNGEFKETTAPTEAELEAAPLRTVYKGSTEDALIVGVSGETVPEQALGYSSYVSYTVSDNTTTGGTVFWKVPDTKLYQDDRVYADYNALTPVMKEETEMKTETVNAPQDGTVLTLTAAATSGDLSLTDRAVEYTFTNLDTGGSYTVSGTLSESATWQASVPGLYRITATTQEAGSYAASNSQSYYYDARAVEPTNKDTTEYRLLIKKSSSVIDSMTYDGQPVTLELQSRTASKLDDNAVTGAGEWQPVTETENVTYTVQPPNGEEKELDNVAYTPNSGETFRFTAKINGNAVAATRLAVDRIPITIGPTWDGKTAEQTGLPTELAAIKPVVTKGNIVEADKKLLEPALIPICALFQKDGKTQVSNGVFDVEFRYAEAADDENEERLKAANELRAKYDVTLLADQVIKISNSATVEYAAGTNGVLTASYESSGTLFKFESETPIPLSNGLTFSAVPEQGFQVADWTVTLDGNVVDSSKYNISINGTSQNLNIASLDNLGATKDSELVVSVSFTNENHTVTYEAAEAQNKGTISAAQNEASIPSNTNVAGGSAVTFTATPEEGYTVESWTVTTGDETAGTVQKNPDGTTFCGNELTLTITANTKVIVKFREKDMHTVTFAATDADGNPAAGASVTAEGLTKTEDGYQIATGGTATFTVETQPGVALQYWQVKRGDGEFQTVANAASNSYTLYNVSENTEVRAVVNENSATQYNLTFTVQDEDGKTVENAGTLTATAHGTDLTSGNTYSTGTPVAFTFTEADAYEVVHWQVNDSTVQTGHDKLTYELPNGLLADTTVVVTVQKKPQITITDSVGGTVEVKAGDETVTSGGYIYAGTDLTVTLKPAKGYEVGEMTANLSYTDGNGETTDDRTYTLENVTSDQTITPVWAALPELTVSYEVADLNSEEEGGQNGTLTAAVNRKGLDVYTVLEFISKSTVYRDSDVTFTAAPDEGYRVQEWKVNGQIVPDEVGNTLTLKNLDANAEVTVQFVEVGSDITVHAGEHGKITGVTVGGNPVENYENGFGLQPGVALAVNVEAAQGYEVKEWKVNGVPQKDKDDQLLTGNTFTYTTELENTGAAITVTFQPIPYTVSWNAEHGTITADVSGENETSAKIRGGTTVNFTAAPESGYVFSHWEVDGEEQENQNNLNFAWTVPTGIEKGTSYEITAVFTRNSEPIEVSYAAEPADYGTIKTTGGTDGKITVTYGDDVTFTADPEQNYHISGWKVNGSLQPGSANQTSFTLENVTEEKQVTVCFAQAVSYEVGCWVVNNNPVTGTLSALADDKPLSLTDSKTRVPAETTLVFNAVPNSNYMVKHWMLNDEIVAGNITNTMTIPSLNETSHVKVEFEQYVGYEIPQSGKGYTITDVKRAPEETYQGAPTDKIRKGGAVTFTVKPDHAQDYAIITSLQLGDADLMGDSLPEHVTVQKNADGNYTITVQNVQEDIDLTVTAHKVVVGALTLPESLKNNPALDSVEKIQTKLETELMSGGDGKAFYDISLKYFDSDKDTWVDVTKENFPENGVNVLLPYPNGTDSRDTFRIAHMLTAEKDGKQPGDVERVSHSNQTDGLQFHVTSLSPFAVSWTKYVPSSGGGGGGGGGGGIAEEETVIVEKPANGSITVDDRYAKKGDTVTLTVQPDDGYTLSRLTVTDKDGKEVKLTEQADGKFTFEMPGTKVTVKATFASAGEWVNPFLDVPDSAWFYDAVQYVNENGLMSGTSKTTFAPSATTTRGMIVVILHRLEEEPAATASAFTDVKAGTYYEKAINWAAANEIVKGVSETTFAPDQAITREQMAAILYRYAQFKGYDMSKANKLDAYADAAQISTYAVPAMQWANAEDLITGKSATVLDPKGNATRAEVASILMRFCENIAK